MKELKKNREEAEKSRKTCETRTNWRETSQKWINYPKINRNPKKPKDFTFGTST